MAEAQANHGRRMILELGKRSGCFSTPNTIDLPHLRDPLASRAVTAIRGTGPEETVAIKG